jgi:hypothetical protein
LKRLILPVVAFVGLAASSAAQPTTPPPSQPAIDSITLGQSILPLNGPWKFTTGDSPLDPATHQPLWSQPSFNDDAWQPYTLDPKHPNLTPFQAAQSPELPGFQSHGHPAYTGYSWYRLQLQPPPGSQSLSLLLPQYIDDAYDVYINGQKIGSFGHLDRWHLVYSGQPELFALPSSTLSSAQPITLTLRFWSARYDADPAVDNLLGGLRSVPLLGPPQLLQIFLQSAQQRAASSLWRLVLVWAASGTVGIISLFLFFFSRRQHEYLWAGLSLAGLAIAAGTITLNQALQSTIPLELSYPVGYIAVSTSFFALPLAAMHLLSVAKPLWRRLNLATSGIVVFYYMTAFCVVLGLLPPSAAMDRMNNLSLAFHIPLILLLLAISIDGLRTIGRKAWLLLTPGFIFAVYLLLYGVFGNNPAFTVPDDLIFAGLPLSVLIIFLLRFTRQQRENARLVDDMKQAAEVQQVLIPEHLPPIPNLTIQTEYRPAREVGGDFFQIIPDPTGNSVLVVAGDVTGKGLQAGMLVALLVGAIRTAADTNSDPLHILQTLNKRLLGRGHAQATALALHISPDGHATLANAGHIPPYLNGQPLAMEGSLPLGMMDGADFSVMHFQLHPNDKLVLISDGILEATDPTGQLFGFDRIQQFLRANLSTSALADAAQLFGQEDDISLIALTRAAQPA